MRSRMEEKRKRRIIFGERTLAGWFLFHAFAMENNAGEFKKSWKKLKMSGECSEK